MQKDFDKNIKNSDLDCEACKDMLYDYVSDNLSAENKTAVEKHIGLCPRCAEELTEVKGMISIMNGFEDIPMPKGLELSLNKALEETANEIKIKNKRLRFRRVTSAVVPFAAAAVLAIGVYSGGAFDKYINSDSIFDGQSTYTEQGDNVSDDMTKNGDYNGDNANGLRDSEKAEKSEESEKSENITDKNNTKTDNKNKGNKNNGAASENNNQKSDSKKSNNIKSDSKKTDNSSSKSQVSDKVNKSNNSSKSENNGRDNDKPENTGNTDNVKNTGNTESTEQVYGGTPQNNEEAKAVDSVSSGGGSGRARGGVTEDAESQPAVVTYGLDDLGDESADAAADKAENSEKPNNSGKSDNYDKSDNSKNIGQRVPASCEIVTSTPEAYASLGLSTGGGSISYTLWESIRAIAVSTGDTLNAYDFADASVNSTISVTLIKK